MKKQKQSEAEAAKATRAGAKELSLRQLEEKLKLMKRRALGLAEENVENEEDVGSIVGAMGIERRQCELEVLEKELSELTRGKDQRNAEIIALRGALEMQRKMAARGMLKRIGQLNAEMDKSPLGEAKRLTMKYKREIRRLGAEVERGWAGGAH